MLICSRNIYFFISIILLFTSCKKNEDTEPPSVSISQPFENEVFNVYDIIHAKAQVSDDNKLTSVSVNLLDAQMNVAHISIPASFTSPSSSIAVDYWLDNIHLESGIYYLKVSASDGENTTNAYKKIQINAVPKVLKKIFVTTASGSSQTNLSYVDSAFTGFINYHSFSGDYIGSSSSSYFQQVFNCGNYSGAFSSVDLNSNNLKFSIAAVQSVYPYFTGYYSSDKTFYTALYSGNVKGYDHAGNNVFTAAANPNFFIENFNFSGGYLLTEQVDKQTSARILTSHQTTGIGYQQTTLNQNVVAFCEKDNENMFVFGNNAGQAVLQLFDRANNNLWNPYGFSLATGSLLSAVKIDSNTYLLGHSNGTIYKYQYQPSSVTVYLNGYIAKQLVYDALNDELYIVEDTKISSVYYSTSSFHYSVNSSETILGISLLYNR